MPTRARARRALLSIIPPEAELTPQQAADFLGVSRPFLIGLIDRGELQHRTVGRDRRMRFADLLAYEPRPSNPADKRLTDQALRWPAEDPPTRHPTKQGWRACAG